MPNRTIVAVIPARGGSKRVPRKNLLSVGGAPLIVHTIRHAREAALVNEVIVSTDDAEIAEVARRAGADIVDRPPQLARDEATSESAVLHALDDRLQRASPDPELVVLLQATSPVRRHGDIDRAIKTLLEAGADSLLSVTASTAFLWSPGEDGARPVNHDPDHRLREQDLPPQYEENGSIYVTRSTVLRDSSDRLGGKIVLYPMDYWASFELDEPADVELLSWIMSRPDYAPAMERPKG